MSWSRAILRRRTADSDVERELRFHIDQQIDDYVRGGMSREEAARRTRLEFGGLQQVKEECRNVLIVRWWNDLVRDVRHASRSMSRSPEFACAAIFTLALGIGGTTLMFSVINAILLRPLPYKDADRLVEILENASGNEHADARRLEPATIDLDELAELRADVIQLSHVGVQARSDVTMQTRTVHALRVTGVRTSPSLLAMTGAATIRGRLLVDGDDVPGAPRVVVIANDIWRAYFGGTDQVVGATLTLDGNPYTVVGVMAPGFRYPGPGTAFWTALVPTRSPGPGGTRRFRVQGRLKDQATLEAASAAINLVLGHMRGLVPDGPVTSALPPAFEVRTLQEETVAPIRPALVVLTVAVGCMLLIACVNVTHLLVAFAASRQREMAVRLALGATPSQLTRQVFAQNLLLSGVGGAVGIALAIGGARALRVLGTGLPRTDMAPGFGIPRVAEVQVDARSLVFACGVCLLTALLCSLGSALFHTRAIEIRRLRENGASDVSGFHLLCGYPIRSLLAATEIALAMPLLIGAALLTSSYLRLSTVDPGYDPTNVLTFQVASPQGANMPTDYMEGLVARFQATPEIAEAAYALDLPMTNGRSGSMLHVPGTPLEEPATDGVGATPKWPEGLGVSREFLKVMRVPLIAGRWFDERDREGQPGVVLINETLARSGYLGANPIGAHVLLGQTPVEVVGIVGDMRLDSLERAPTPQVFTDPRQRHSLPRFTGLGSYFVVRTQRPLTTVVPAIRRIVQDVDPQAAIDNVAPMEAVIAHSLTRPRFYAVLLASFAGTAIALTGVGLYGVIAFLTARRTKEIGIRLALGARPIDVLALLLRQAATVTATGLCVGVFASVLVTGYFEAMLYGVGARDIATFVWVSISFAAIATVAAIVPARRAVRLDPAVTLRSE